MTETWRESLSYVWNIISGISSDKQAKISRLVFFCVVALGIGIGIIGSSISMKKYLEV